MERLKILDFLNNQAKQRKRERQKRRYHEKNYVYHQERHKAIREDPEVWRFVLDSSKPAQQRYNVSPKGFMKKARRFAKLHGIELKLTLDYLENYASLHNCFMCQKREISTFVQGTGLKAYEPRSIKGLCLQCHGGRNGHEIRRLLNMRRERKKKKKEAKLSN